MPRSLIVPALLIGGLLLIVSISAGVSLGAVPIPLETVWGVVANKLSPGAVEVTWSAGRESIVWDVRFPRVILGALVGAGVLLVRVRLLALLQLVPRIAAHAGAVLARGARLLRGGDRRKRGDDEREEQGAGTHGPVF